jgi:hypothetical protein
MPALAPFLLSLVLNGSITPQEATVLQIKLTGMVVEKDFYRLWHQLEEIICRTITINNNANNNKSI